MQFQDTLQPIVDAVAQAIAAAPDDDTANILRNAMGTVYAVFKREEDRLNGQPNP